MDSFKQFFKFEVSYWTKLRQWMKNKAAVKAAEKIKNKAAVKVAEKIKNRVTVKAAEKAFKEMGLPVDV